MTKKDLIKYSANEVKRNKTLFAEFIRLYELEFNNKPNCSACVFNSTFSRWKNKGAIKKQINMPNTFKLKVPTHRYRIPFTSEVLTKDSPDELALKYLNQNKKRYRKERETIFLELPKTATRKRTTKKVTPKK